MSCIQLSKTLQSEYLIFPVNSTVEMGTSSLVANWMKTKKASDGILYLPQSVPFWNIVSWWKDGASHNLNNHWTQHQGKIYLLDVQTHFPSDVLQSGCIHMHNYSNRIQFVKENKLTRSTSWGICLLDGKIFNFFVTWLHMYTAQTKMPDKV